MDRFAEALLSRQANHALPLEDDWFAPLLGDWEFDYQDRGGRRLKIGRASCRERVYVLV